MTRSNPLLSYGLVAVQLLCLGLLGEYVGRMYTMLQGRPSYFVAYDSADPAVARSRVDQATGVTDAGR